MNANECKTIPMSRRDGSQVSNKTNDLFSDTGRRIAWIDPRLFAFIRVHSRPIPAPLFSIIRQVHNAQPDRFAMDHVEGFHFAQRLDEVAQAGLVRGDDHGHDLARIGLVLKNR